MPATRGKNSAPTELTNNPKGQKRKNQKTLMNKKGPTSGKDGAHETGTENTRTIRETDDICDELAAARGTIISSAIKLSYSQ